MRPHAPHTQHEFISCYKRLFEPAAAFFAAVVAAAGCDVGPRQHTNTSSTQLTPVAPQPQRALPETDNSYYVHKSGYAWRSDEGGDWDVDAPPDNEHINQTPADAPTET